MAVANPAAPQIARKPKPVFPGGPVTTTPQPFTANLLGGMRPVASANGSGAKVDPRFSRPVTPPQQTAPVQSPTFQQPQQDPRIQELLRQLQANQNAVNSAGPNTLKKLDLSGIDAQGGQLRALLAQLMRGEGIQVGDLSNDPEARAFAVSRQRAAERAREEEAARLGASGVSGSGDFDARAAQIREAAGTDIAGNVAALTGKRRDQALSTAITGANLQLSDLDRQARLKTTEFQGALDAERTRQGQSQIDAARFAAEQASRQRLLETLLGEDARQRTDARSDFERRRTEESDRLAEELRRQELQRQLRQFGPREGAPATPNQFVRRGFF